MSLSWRDQLVAFVAPGAVGVQVQSRGWWPAGRGAVRPADVSAPEPLLASTLQAAGDDPAELAVQLADALRAHAGRPFDIAVVLSNGFVRYAVVADAAQLRGEAERSVAAAQALRSVYGGTGDDWQAVMDDEATSVALVAGVRRPLVEALHGACKAAGARRVSIEPLFAHALNACRAQVDATTGWFGTVEGDRLVLASLGEEGVTGVRSQRLSRDPATEVAALVQRARLLDGTPAHRSTLVLASGQPLPVAFPPDSGLQLQPVALRCMASQEA